MGPLQGSHVLPAAALAFWGTGSVTTGLCAEDWERQPESQSPLPELAPQDISKGAGMEDRGIFPRVILVRKAENTGVNKPGPERVMDPYFCLRWMAGRPQGHHS